MYIVSLNLLLLKMKKVDRQPDQKVLIKENCQKVKIIDVASVR